MILKISDFEEMSGVSSPLIPLFFCNYKFPSSATDVVYKIVFNGKTEGFISVKSEFAFCLACTDISDIDELESFLSFLHIDEFLSDFRLGEYSGKVFLMTAPTRRYDKNDCTVSSQRWNTRCYRALFGLLDGKGDFTQWFTSFSRKINEGYAFAVCKGEPFIGCAVAPFVYGASAVVSGVFTMQNYRNKGIASECLKTLMSVLCDNRVENAALWCSEDNCGFYEKNGFRVEKTLYLRKGI